MRPHVPYKVLHNYDGPEVPFREAYTGDVGYDLYACKHCYHMLAPGEKALIPTGLAIALPPGVEAQVRTKSGLALNLSLVVLNSPGTIDPTYRGEIGVIAYNATPSLPLVSTHQLINVLKGNLHVAALEDQLALHQSLNTITIKPGMKLGQLVFSQFLTPTFERVAELDETVRGDRGFGSSGIYSTGILDGSV